MQWADRSALLLQKGLLDVPELLRQVHVVVMGVLKALNLVPQQVDLSGAVGPHLGDGGESYTRLPPRKMGASSSLAVKLVTRLRFQVASGSKSSRDWLSSTASSWRVMRSAKALPLSLSNRRYTFLKWGLVILSGLALILILGMILPCLSSTAASL